MNVYSKIIKDLADSGVTCAEFEEAFKKEKQKIDNDFTKKHNNKEERE